MNVLHIALTCSSEERADQFYAGLLGLEKQDPKIVPAEVSHALFNISSELRVINYTGPAVRFEIFFDSNQPGNPRRIDHVCIEVDDLEKFLQNCRRADVKVMQVLKGDALVTFIKDFEGNLFEVKGR